MIKEMAARLHPKQRGAFLEAVARRLANVEIRGLPPRPRPPAYARGGLVLQQIRCQMADFRCQLPCRARVRAGAGSLPSAMGWPTRPTPWPGRGV